MTNKLILCLLSLMLLATPAWAEDCKCMHDAESYVSMQVEQVCIQLCEIKEILKELVNK